MSFSLAPQDLGAIVSAIFSPISSFLACVAIFYTSRTLGVIRKQLEEQQKYNRSQSRHATINAHRELFSLILGDNELLKALSSENVDVDVDEAKQQILGTLLVNHCLRVFIDRVRYFEATHEAEAFIADAKSLFSIGLVDRRWLSVRSYHPTDFVEFIESKVRQKKPD